MLLSAIRKALSREPIRQETLPWWVTGEVPDLQESTEFSEAKQTMAEAFEEDTALRDTYVSAIAVVLAEDYEEESRETLARCTEQAQDLLTLIFET